MPKKWICTIAILMLSSVVIAQESRNITVKGQLADSSGEPIAYAVVSVSLKTDSASYLNSIATDKDGLFSFQNLNPEKYRLEITHILYDPLYLNVDVIEDINLGKVHMVDRVVDVGQAVVTGKIIQRFSDRYTINLKNNAVTRGKNVKELLGFLPGVSTDQGLSINGIGGTRVYVNGREVRDQAELEALEAANLNKIEVIYIPGSGYDAQTRGGIINIQLDKLPDGGYFGTISAGVSIRLHHGISGDNINSIFNYRYKKLSLYNYISYDNFKSIYDYDISSRYPASGISMHTVSRERGWSETFSNNLSLMYDFNDNHSLGGNFRINLSGSDPRKISYSQIYNIDGSVENSFSDILTKTNRDIYQGAINYTWRFGDNGSNLRIIADYMSNNNSSQTRYNYGFGDNPNEITDIKRDDRLNKTEMMEIDAKAEFKLSDNSIITTGTRLYTHNMRRRLLYEYLANDMWITDSNLSDNFNVKGNGYGVFADFRQNAGNFSYAAGIRIQQDNVSHHSIRTAQKVSRRYFNFFPTVSLGYSLPEDDIFFNLSYSRGLDYIPYNEISPAVTWQSEFSYSKGNPDLYPAVDNLIQFSGSLKKWNLFYNFYHTKGEIYYLTFLDADNPMIKYSMPVNAGTSFYHIAGFSRNFKVTKWWDCNVYMQLRSFSINYEEQGKKKRQSSTNYRPSVNNSFEFNDRYGASLDFSAETRSVVDDKTMLGVYNFGVGAYGYFFDKKLLVRLSSQPLYSKLRDMEINKDNYWAMSRFRTSQSNIRISATYNFKGGKQNIRISRARTIQTLQERNEGSN